MEHERYSQVGPRARRNWLPPAIAIAVTGASGMVALAGLASGALADVPPYPSTGWLSAGLFAQAALGVAAVTLLILTRVMARGPHLFCDDLVTRLQQPPLLSAHALARQRPYGCGLTAHLAPPSSLSPACAASA